MNQLVKFEPQKTTAKEIALDAHIKFAAKIKDWPALREAVELKVEEQRDFVAWWNANVGGRGRPQKNADRGSFSVDKAEELTNIKQQQVSRWRKRLGNVQAYKDDLYGRAYNAAMAEEHNHRAQGTGENEWYTPAKYIELARAVLGGIDLDPASSKVAQKIVRATEWFDIKSNGLLHNWNGRVWLNPPYAQPLIGRFVSKLMEQLAASNVMAAIMLTHNYTDTSWFHEAAELTNAICFTRGRIKFVDAGGNESAPTQGQSFFYYGPDIELFREKFLAIGFVVRP